MTAILSDNTGNIELVWFKNFSYIFKALKEDGIYTVYGKINEFKGKVNIAHPEIKLYDTSDDSQGLKMEPVYSLTEKLKSRFMDSRYILTLVRQILQHPEFDIEEFIPVEVSKPLKLLSGKAALYYMHLPENEKQAEAASRRIRFEEMFSLAMRSEKIRAKRWQDKNGIKMSKTGALLNDFYHDHLAFELTDAQKKVIKEIRADMVGGRQMNRLLQGDVGSGKTIVALFCMLMCLDNGYQACMMAPTEILATQHFITLSDLLSELPVKVELLTGSTPKKKRAFFFFRNKLPRQHTRKNWVLFPLCS